MVGWLVDKKMILGMLGAFLIGIFALFLWQRRGVLIEQLAQPVLTEVTPTQTPTVLPTNLPQTTGAVSPVPTVAPTVTPDPYGNWTQYTNNNHKYRFQYDPNWNLGTQSNTTFVQGDVSTKGWPSINVSKLTIIAGDTAGLKTEVENLFGVSTNIVSFGVGNIPAVLWERAASPQAYAGKDYYFLHNGYTLLISLNDTGHTEGDSLYQEFLDNFELY